jgi:hypothetical protein
VTSASSRVDRHRGEDDAKDGADAAHPGHPAIPAILRNRVKVPANKSSNTSDEMHHPQQSERCRLPGGWRSDHLSVKTTIARTAPGEKPFGGGFAMAARG